MVAQAIDRAVKACDLHPGVFSQIQGGNRSVGTTLVQHPLIKAVGFTGSLGGGRALFDLCAARPEPIPFFGELGSVNPMFILPKALAARGDAIAEGWAGSLTMGAGQFCTNPGVAVLRAGSDADAFAEAVVDALAQVAPQIMLTQGIADAYHKGCARFAGSPDLRKVMSSSSAHRNAAPCLFSGNRRRMAGKQRA